MSRISSYVYFSGLAALNPKFYTNASACHYQGSACGTCYALQGPAGGAKIAVTDCCAGYLYYVQF